MKFTDDDLAELKAVLKDRECSWLEMKTEKMRELVERLEIPAWSEVEAKIEKLRQLNLSGFDIRYELTELVRFARGER